MRKTLKERFTSKYTIDPQTQCWNWTGCVTKWGYGYFKLKEGAKLAHRVSYSLYKEEVPPELCVLHHCDNPACVNPDHLFLGTNYDNVQDKVRKNRQSKIGQQKGEAHSLCKLTEKDVLFIRERTLSQTQLAMRFGVTQSQISHIQRRVCWTHI